ncbi:hypothetical protein BDR22DRAFT_285525 [Usnea florida]
MPTLSLGIYLTISFSPFALLIFRHCCPFFLLSSTLSRIACALSIDSSTSSASKPSSSPPSLPAERGIGQSGFHHPQWPPGARGPRCQNKVGGMMAVSGSGIATSVLHTLGVGLSFVGR